MFILKSLASVVPKQAELNHHGGFMLSFSLCLKQRFQLCLQRLTIRLGVQDDFPKHLMRLVDLEPTLLYHMTHRKPNVTASTLGHSLS